MNETQRVQWIFQNYSHPSIVALKELYNRGVIPASHVIEVYNGMNLGPPSEEAFTTAGNVVNFNPNTTEVPPTRIPRDASGFTATSSESVPVSRNVTTFVDTAPEQTEKKPFYKQPLFIAGAIVAGGFVIKKLLK